VQSALLANLPQLWQGNARTPLAPEGRLHLLVPPQQRETAQAVLLVNSHQVTQPSAKTPAALLAKPRWLVHGQKKDSAKTVLLANSPLGGQCNAHPALEGNMNHILGLQIVHCVGKATTHTQGSLIAPIVIVLQEQSQLCVEPLTII
jgi:hypothetical protein